MPFTLRFLAIVISLSMSAVLLLTSWESILSITVTPDFSVLQDTFTLELPV